MWAHCCFEAANSCLQLQAVDKWFYYFFGLLPGWFQHRP